MLTYRRTSLNQPQLNQLQKGLCNEKHVYINKKHFYKSHSDVAIYKSKNLSLFLLKLFYPKKLTSLLHVYINIHVKIYAHLMLIILIP